MTPIGRMVDRAVALILIAFVLAAALALASIVSALAEQRGIASIYSLKEFPRGQTASGTKLNDGHLQAAHRDLPFGTRVEVTNERNGKTITVLILDRGPFVRGRVIDLTPAGAQALGFSGLAPVRLRVLPLEE